MRSRLMTELISTRSESSARPGSRMGWPGKMRTAPGVVQLARELPKLCNRVTRVGRPEPYHGYYFKILKGQGPAAPLGKMDFVVKGVMIGGFALVAVPAEYRVTGVKTFIVSYKGVVYEKDLGPNSLDIVKKMELYNPDRTWRPTDASW